MEQHLYTYLNQKYGLKGLIVEHAAAIIRSATKYNDADNDVAVFVKILRYGRANGCAACVRPRLFTRWSCCCCMLFRNDVDEEFRLSQSRLKASVENLLEAQLRTRFPLKTGDVIRRLLARRLQVLVPCVASVTSSTLRSLWCSRAVSRWCTVLQGQLSEEEWVSIVTYLYGPQDVLSVIVLVRERIGEGYAWCMRCSRATAWSRCWALPLVVSQVVHAVCCYCRREHEARLRTQWRGRVTRPRLDILPGLLICATGLPASHARPILGAVSQHVPVTGCGYQRCAVHW
jgi:hypothetical protein